MGALRSHYGMLWGVTEPLQNIMEHYKTLQSCYGMLQSVRSITEHCRMLQNVTEALWIVTECFRTVTQNIDFVTGWGWCHGVSCLKIATTCIHVVCCWYDYACSCKCKTLKWLLHLCKFLLNPTSILNLIRSSESQWKDVSSDILSIGNSVNFSHTSLIHFCSIMCHWLQKDVPNSTSKQPLLLWQLPPLSNTPIPWPILLTFPNGIQIQSAVMPQYTLRTHRPTDGTGDRCHWRLCSLYW